MIGIVLKEGNDTELEEELQRCQPFLVDIEPKPGRNEFYI